MLLLIFSFRFRFRLTLSIFILLRMAIINFMYFFSHIILKQHYTYIWYQSVIKFWLYIKSKRRVRIKIMVFNPTFNNISAISWRPFSWVEEIGTPGENPRPVASPWQTLSYDIVSSTPRLIGIWTHKDNGKRHWWHR
jgi:hypothetical protein